MDIRASDDDRRRTMDALERHAGAGRLSLDEFAERSRAACEARTLAELAAVVHDLPAQEAPPRRELYWVFALAAGTLLVLALFVGLR